jgi:hypothetical protein
MSTAMDRVRREQAIRSAALAILEASDVTGESLESAAYRFTREPALRRAWGINSSGAEIAFTWIYGEQDIPDLIAQARVFDQETRPRQDSAPGDSWQERLDYLKACITGYDLLLADPHPGLATWHEARARGQRRIAEACRTLADADQEAQS